MSYEPVSNSFDQVRRRAPRLFDTDWLLLRGLAAEVTDAARRIGRAGLTAIDLGCGDQPYRAFFEREGVTYRAADFGRSAEIKIAEDGQVESPDGSADLLLSFQVLEHVRDLDIYLGEAKRLLRPDGRLLLSTHGTWLYHPHPEDHRRWTRQGLIHDVEVRGFKILSCKAVVGPLALTTILRLTGFASFLRRVPFIGRPAAGALAIIMNLRAAVEDLITPNAIRDDNACVYVVEAVAR